MKDKWAVLSATVIVLILMGGISVMSVKYASGRGSVQGRASLVWGGKAELRNVIELPLSDVESLTLEYGSKNIRVYPSEKDAVVIKEYLYSDEAQRLAGQNYYRPSREEILQEFSGQFDLAMNLVTIDDFGGWKEAYKTFFDDGAVFDQIYAD